MDDHRCFYFRRHIAPGVLKQRYEIIGRMTCKRVLKIKQAKPAHFGAIDQHDIFSMVIAQHRDGGAGRLLNDRQHGIPGADIGLRIDWKADRGAVPFGKQSRFALIDRAIIGRQVGGGRAMKIGQQFDRLAIHAKLVRGDIVEMFLDPQIAEILDKDQTLLKVASEDRGGSEALSHQMFSDCDKGARVFVRWRRIHQHGPSRAVDHAEVAAEGCIARQWDDRGMFPPRS